MITAWSSPCWFIFQACRHPCIYFWGWEKVLEVVWGQGLVLSGCDRVGGAGVQGVVTALSTPPPPLPTQPPQQKAQKPKSCLWCFLWQMWCCAHISCSLQPSALPSLLAQAHQSLVSYLLVLEVQTAPFVPAKCRICTRTKAKGSPCPQALRRGEAGALCCQESKVRLRPPKLPVVSS